MSADEKVFIDSNVLVYTQSIDEQEKRIKAQQVIDLSREAYISTQVLNEVSNVLAKKKDVPPLKIKLLVNTLVSMFAVEVIDIKRINKAFDLMDKYKYSYYDSLIIATALEAGCTILFSEDMSSGSMIEGQLRIIDPFV